MKNDKKNNDGNNPMAQELQNINAKQHVAIATTPLKPESRRDMRALAFHFVYATDRLDYTVPLNQVIESFKTGFNVEIEDDSLAVKMASGVVKEREQLDHEIKPLLRNWKFERLGCCTRLILRLALWEMHQPEAIPSVIINEAIELAKSFAEKDAYKFINGILDEASKKISSKEKEEHESSKETGKPEKN